MKTKRKPGPKPDPKKQGSEARNYRYHTDILQTFDSLSDETPRDFIERLVRDSSEYKEKTLNKPKS